MNNQEFRAWIVSNNKYIYVCGFIFLNTEIRIWWQDLSNHIYNKSFAIKDVVLEQSTGLRDKGGRGKTIYHNDIFPKGGKVQWVDYGWFVVFPSYEIPLSVYINNDARREVIGNKFQGKL